MDRWSNSPGLRDAKLKADRAQKHLEALDTELRIFFKAHPAAVTREEDRDNGLHVIRFEMAEAPPEISLIAGDAINCTRAALDHVAWQLALLTTDKPTRDTAFPILGVGSESNFKSIVKDMPFTALDLIESFQPYTDGNAYKDNPLWQLHKLCIVDKHRRIPVIGQFANFSYRAPPGVKELISFQAVDDYATMSFPSSVKSQVEFKPLLVLGMVFGDPAVGVSIEGTRLGAIHKFVRDDVIPEFAGFFPEPKGAYGAP